MVSVCGRNISADKLLEKAIDKPATTKKPNRESFRAPEEYFDIRWGSPDTS